MPALLTGVTRAVLAFALRLAVLSHLADLCHLAGLWHVAGYLPGPAGNSQALAGAVLAAALLAVVAIGCVTVGATFGRARAPIPVARRVTAQREKSWHAAFQRLRDPDAPGRARPRAPAAAPAAAATLTMHLT
jgi:hypothetical protein